MLLGSAPVLNAIHLIHEPYFILDFLTIIRHKILMLLGF